MPRHDAPRITTIDATTGRPVDDDPTNTIEDDIAKQLDDIIAEFGQSETDVTWQVVVTRASGPFMKGPKEPYLFSCDPSDIGGIRDRLRDEYGEGTYRIRVRKNGRNHRQFDYTIEAPIKTKTDTTDGVTRALLERMDRMEARSNDVLQQLITARTTGGTLQPLIDPIAMFEKFATIMAAMNAGRPPPDAAMDTVGRAFDMATKIIELRGDNGGGGTPETNVFDIIKEAVKNPNLVDAIAQNARAGQTAPALPMRRQPAAPGGVQPGPIPTAPAHAPTNTVNDAGATVVTADDYGFVIPYLNTCAARGANVEFYCDWVLDNVTTEQLTTLINHPTIIDFLSTRYPGMVPYRPWYERLLVELRAAVQSDAYADANEDDGTSASQVMRERADGGTAAPVGSSHARSDVLDSLTRPKRNPGNAKDNGGQGAHGEAKPSGSGGGG